MHIVIAAITAIAGLIWALNSLQNSGVDLNSFNPFTWARRRKWEKSYGQNPLYNLAKPMEAAAVIMVGVLKEEGEITREQKHAVIDMFKRNFHLSEPQALELFASSSHLVRNELNFYRSIPNILRKSITRFTSDMAESLMNMLVEIAELENAPTEAQISAITAVEDELNEHKKIDSLWDLQGRPK